MNNKSVYLLLILFSLIVISYYVFSRTDSEKTGLLVLPYEYYSEPEEILLDISDFKYLLKSNVCKKNSSIIHIVTSYAGNVEARSALRRAYSSSELELLGVSRVFLLAVLPPTHQVTQKALINENERFNDLVQGSFLEAYKNLTYKHVMGLKWVVDNCKNAKYIIKSDDDILIDMYSLVNLIENKEFSLMGYVLHDMRPIRMKANKWYVTKEEYSEDSYPPFLSGWMYVIQTETASKLLSHARDFKYFWIDDLFVTGILAKEANVPLTDIRELFSLHPEVVECCIRKGLECRFLAAPSGGDYALQLKFQIHSRTCYKDKCPTLPPGVKVEDKCVASRKLPPLKKGLPRLTVIQ